jgi:uncharacterized protein (DUF1800 family)
MAASALPSLTKVDPATAWRPWQPDAEDRWNLKWAGHLYRRAGFGASPTELYEAVAKGFEATFDLLLPSEPRADRRERQLALDGDAIARRNNPVELRGWWLDRMYYTSQPLREKMALFWHNHFATSVIKVQSVPLMHRQNELIRRRALDKFGPFLLDMSRDPAMLVWLDSNSNVKSHPNENYAREVMELFSLGVGHYKEKDILEAARAFTGWHTRDGQFAFNEGEHDGGQKTVLGQTGDWDGGDIVRIVLKQRAAPRFLVRKLYRNFISELAEPPDALLEPLAEELRKSEYDMAGVLRTMLRSRHFFSAHAYRQRVKSPVEFGLSAIRSLGQGFVSPRGLVKKMEAMGQQLFAPPNVKGWEGGRAWLNTATLLARHDFARAMAMGNAEVNLDAYDPTGTAAIVSDPSFMVRRQNLTEPARIVAFYADLLVQGDLRDSARKKLIAFMEEGNPTGNELDKRIREMIHALMTTPEYQLA